MVNKVEKFEDIAAVIRVYEENIRTKISNTVGITYQQFKVFKRFKKKTSLSKWLKKLMSINQQSSLR